MFSQEQSAPPRGTAAITAIAIQSGLIYLLAVGLGVAPSVQESVRSIVVDVPPDIKEPTIIEPPQSQDPKSLFEKVKPEVARPVLIIEERKPDERSALGGTTEGSGPIIPTLEPIVPARVLMSAEPAYPSSSVLRQEQGTVHVRIQLSATGKVLTAQVERTSGFSRLDEAALKAVRGWRFAAATRGGQGVSTWVVVPVVFELR